MNLNNKKPLFTIITATFNASKTILTCLNSVKSQTNADYEHIIIDGMSSDNTMEIVTGFKSSKVRWLSEPDQGIYDAWNKGVKMATGEWIMFLGSDDILYAEALETYAEEMKRASFPKDVQFISSKIHLVDTKGNIYKTHGRAYQWSKFRRSVIIAHPGSLHNRTLFDKFGLFDIDYKICGDYEFLLRVGSSLRTHYVDFVAVAMADGGVSNNNYRKVFKEHFRAVTRTGGLNRWIAFYDYIILNVKVALLQVIK